MSGSLEVIAGCMFSGKSEELIRRVRRCKIGAQSVIIFKPEVDDRYEVDKVSTHTGIFEKAVIVNNVFDIKHKALDYDVVAIDEIQFFDSKIIKIIDGLVKQGKKVICSGLDMDFKKESFLVTSVLLAKADKIDKLSAVCIDCGKDATKTQRLVNGQPVYAGETVVIGGEESYKAVCNDCY